MFNLHVRIRRVNEFRLEQKLMEYLRAGGDVNKLSSEMLRKYKEISGNESIPLDDDEDKELQNDIDKEIQCLKI